MAEWDESLPLERRLMHVAATMACHGSVRAGRRLKELQERGEGSIHSRVLRDIEERDARDRSRAVAPLVPAPDALILDTTALDADAAFAAALAFIASRNTSGVA